MAKKKRASKKPTASLLIKRWRWFVCLYLTTPLWLFAPIAMLLPNQWSVASLFFLVVFLLLGFWGLKTQVKCRHCQTSLWSMMRLHQKNKSGEQPFFFYLIAAFISRRIANSYFYGTSCPQCKVPLHNC